MREEKKTKIVADFKAHVMPVGANRYCQGRKFSSADQAASWKNHLAFLFKMGFISGKEKTELESLSIVDFA